MEDVSKNDCPHCDTFGGTKTYENQACMPLNGKVQCIDRCIHQIVAALNAGGVWTTGSCCGHRQQFGFIELGDGRWLTITQGEPEWIQDEIRRHAELEQHVVDDTAR